ncbi:hypothetical protein M8818_002689 [Zalaria obscura]|uniref:Uncharacterized protein n=1 Tax=Zalaria obscura TaxID=2024903 RepID=A0ACC3SGM1_9PEZI
MPPQSRGNSVQGLHSKSTPNLPTLHTLSTDSAAGSTNEGPSNTTAESALSPISLNSPSEAASIEDFSLDANPDDLDSASSSSGESDTGPISNLPPRPLYHHHSRSHTYLGSATFAPPFYNRPPTPLPPSPSLTSLLRPNFSAQTSRPTTPDPSSDEGTGTTTGNGTQTPNSAAASTLTTSFRTARPIPRASPKVPTYEYYGFTLYLTSSLAFLIYLLWSFLPSPFLHQLGIYYYPNRWWSLAIPAWLVMLIVYIYVALASYNTGTLTLPMKDVRCLVDEAANIAVVDSKGRIVRKERSSWKHGSSGHDKGTGKRAVSGKGAGHSRRGSRDKQGHSMSAPGDLDWKILWNEGTDAVMDVPIGGVCEVLYGMGREDGVQ